MQSAIGVSTGNLQNSVQLLHGRMFSATKGGVVSFSVRSVSDLKFVEGIVRVYCRKNGSRWDVKARGLKIFLRKKEAEHESYNPWDVAYLTD